MFDNSISTKFIERENLYQIIPNKKSLPIKISLVEVSFEIVFVEGFSSTFLVENLSSKIAWERRIVFKLFGG